MTASKRLLVVLGAAVFALAASAAGAQPRPKVFTAQVPQVRLLPTTATSKPFRSKADELEKVGYVEEEYLLSGQARVYDWAPGGGVRVIAGPTPYATRILVQRPKDPERFSGNVEVEIINSSARVDNVYTGAKAATIRRGDVYVGMTSKGITARGLQTYDAARYADLNWKNPLPADKTCKDPSIGPLWTRAGAYANADSSSAVETEDGLVWDMFAQLGALLKSPQRQAVLPGFREPRLFATGISQSGLLLHTWINAFHAQYRLAGGRPIYDGYLETVGAAMFRINQCGEDILPWDPRSRLTAPTDAAVINMFTESDMWKGVYTRTPDVVRSHSGLVTYELAGSDHSGRLFPWRPARSGEGLHQTALGNLQDWVIRGVAPPQAGPIETILITIQRDEYGNAKGGLRTPYLDVPFATYRANVAPMASGPGERVVLPPEKLKRLYPTKAAYLAKFNAHVDRLVRERWLSPQGAAEMKADAATAPIPD